MKKISLALLIVSNLAIVAGAEVAKLVYALPTGASPVIPYIALDKGFFKEEGLDVEGKMFSSGREALQALLSHEAQLQTVSETPLVHAAIQGNKFVTVATVARNRETKLIARKDSGIVKPEDLAGKRVATLPGSNSDYFMHRFLAKHGLSPDKLKIANMPPPDMVAAFSKGDIDAYFAWEPHIYYGLKQLPDSLVFGPDDIYQGWAAVNMDPEFVKANPRTTRKVIRALLKAEAYVKAHKDECLKLVAARLKMDEAVLAKLWAETEYKVELDKSLVSEMNDIGAWALKLNKSDKALPNFREYVHEEFLRAERPKAVSL